MMRFANFKILFVFIPIFLLFILYRLYFYKSNKYIYPLSGFLKYKKFSSKSYLKKILFLLRFFALLVLIFLLAKPQLADVKSKINVEGRDIILVLDVSGSMSTIDNESNQKTRIDIAKQEAINFVQKRENDQIGLILFGNVAITRCPLTMDKNILQEIIKDINLGVIDHKGTVLSIGLMTAINRLKSSVAKTKVIILLTDGQPTPNDIPFEVPLEIAKKMKIKIYTVGIGSAEDLMVPGWGQYYIQGVNAELLKKIAEETNGRFFMANSQKDMKDIYNQIDKLETTKFQTEIFNKYYDFFIPFLWIIFLLLFLEFFISTFVLFTV